MATNKTEKSAKKAEKKDNKFAKQLARQFDTRQTNKKGLVSTMVGAGISLINAIIQYLLIYWVLQCYGTEFNGFIRLTSALAIVGGTTEGARGISTVVMLIKPLQNDDFITANEIFSTAKTKYKQGIISGSVFVALVAVLYPLEIVLAPAIDNHFKQISWDIPLTNGATTFTQAPFWELVIIVFFFGIKNVVTAGVFGAYENLIQADQQNGVRRLIILFTDLIVYGILFYLINLTQANGDPLMPLIPFSILLIYGPLRGALIMMYVKKNYKWLKYYPDFNNFQANKTSFRMLVTNIGQNILFNSDILIVMLVLGAYGLRTESMLSLYLVIGVNTRLIMTNFITSFREYFVSVLVENGRLYWEAYSKYELYMYAVSAFTFVIMSTLSPYLVSALYDSAVSKDLSGLQDIIYYQKQVNPNGTIANLNPLALQQAYEWMFQKPTFSLLYAGTTALILMIQGQFTLVQAKGRVEQVSKATNWIAGIYLVIEVGTTLAFSIPQKNNFIVDTLIDFYSIKLGFLAITYFYFWIVNYQKGTYNSSLKHVLPNFMALAIPVAAASVIDMVAMKFIYPLTDMKSIGWLILLIALVVGIGLGAVIVTSLAVRPKVALSLVLMLPIVKQIVDKSKNKAKYARLRDANIDLDKISANESLYSRDILAYDDQKFNYSSLTDYDEVFKPKIYKLKANWIEEQEG